ncbi:MAG: hypothetical protein KY476_15205 [Planctomycetes bacterium]|nr:hypothetical protein [Planctomycetota bacterium]
MYAELATSSNGHWKSHQSLRELTQAVWILASLIGIALVLNLPDRRAEHAAAAAAATLAAQEAGGRATGPQPLTGRGGEAEIAAPEIAGSPPPANASVPDSTSRESQIVSAGGVNRGGAQSLHTKSHPSDEDTAPAIEFDEIHRPSPDRVVRYTSYPVERRAGRPWEFSQGLEAFWGRHYVLAAREFSASRVAEPGDPAAVYFLALAQYRSGNVDAAERAVQEAVELELDRPLEEWGTLMERVQGPQRFWIENQRTRRLFVARSRAGRGSRVEGPGPDAGAG